MQELVLHPGVVQGLGYPASEPQGVGFRDDLVYLQAAAQFGAVDVFHSQIAKPLGHARLISRDYVRVVQATEDLYLLFEARYEVGIAGDFPGEDFQRDMPVERLLLGQPDFAHAARAEPSYESEAVQRQPWLQAQLRHMQGRSATGT
jgi:hypothetical protein